MIKGDYDKLIKIAEINVCAKCKGRVEVAWLGGEEKTYVLRCQCGDTAAVSRVMSPTEEHKAGLLVPERSVINLLPDKDLGDNSLLPLDRIQALIEFAEELGLDAYRGHVVLMYGQPYVGLDGYLYHANRSRRPYRLESRPLTEDERAAMQLKKGDHGWKSDITFPDTNQLFTGIGIVTRGEMTETSKKKPDQLRYPVVAAKPQIMAQKRADWQALRRAFPLERQEVK